LRIGDELMLFSVTTSASLLDASAEVSFSSAFAAGTHWKVMS
jgi:hypothetical protein